MFKTLLIGFACCMNSRAEGPGEYPVRALPQWGKQFKLQKGWLGGDGLYSVQLKSGKVLWFFGDSIFGEIKEGKRTKPIMVNNCVGTQDRPGGPAHFFTQEREGKKPGAFFSLKDSKSWFWPMAAFMAGDQLLVHLAEIEKTGGDGVFAFRQEGHYLARIQNPDALPTDWNVEYLHFPHSRFEKNLTLFWGSAVVQTSDFYYHLGYRETKAIIGSKELVVSRVPIAKLVDFKSWEFYSGSGWSVNPVEAKPLCSGLASEFSVLKISKEKGFLLVYTENGLGDRIVCRKAEALTGVWSKPEFLFQCPEMAKDKGVFCYSGKAHPWSLAGEKFVVTYCVNTWDFWRLFKDENVYLPHFLEVQIPKKK